MGEILVKFSPTANNHIVELLESEGAEAVMPDLMDFLLYCFYNSNFKAASSGRQRHSTAWLCNTANLPSGVFPQVGPDRAGKAATTSRRPQGSKYLATMASGFVSLGNQTGEGWFLTGEMLELHPQAAPGTSSASSPSAACPTISWAKGVIKELRRQLSRGQHHRRGL